MTTADNSRSRKIRIPDILNQAGARRIVLTLLAIVFFVVLASTTGLSPSSGTPKAFLVSKPKAGELSIDLVLSPPTLKLGSNPEIGIQNLTYAYGDAEKVCTDRIWVVQLLKRKALSWQTPTGVEYPICRDLGGLQESSSSKATEFRVATTNWPLDFVQSHKPRSAISRRQYYDPSGQQVIQPTSTNVVWMPLESERNHFWYPFDAFTLKLTMGGENRFIKAGQTITTTASHLIGSVYVPDPVDWEIHVKEIPASAAERQFLRGMAGDVERLLVVEFHRPLFEQLAIPLVVIAMYLFVILLCLIDSLGIFIEGGVVLFFGIFSLRQILLPATAEIRTIVDWAAWGLYFAFAGVLIYYLWSELRSMLRRRVTDPAKPGPDQVDRHTDLGGRPGTTGLPPEQSRGARHPVQARSGLATSLTLLGIAALFAVIYRRALRRK